MAALTPRRGEAITRLEHLQTVEAAKVVVCDRYPKPVTTVAGIDVAYQGDVAVAACVVVRVPSLRVSHRATRISGIRVPYASTLLSFREGPSVVQLMESLTDTPDVYLVNAHGIAHPRFCGCASHVGVATQRPTIGVAVRNLCGVYSASPSVEGEAVAVAFKGRPVGWVYKSKAGCNPIFISPGHMVSVASSLDIVRRCIGVYKLPVPLHLAHSLANDVKRQLPQKLRFDAEKDGPFDRDPLVSSGDVV